MRTHPRFSPIRSTAARIALITVAGGAAACAHSVAPRTAPVPGMYALSMNGKPVEVPTLATVSDALREGATWYVAAGFHPLHGQPLYVVDGVPVEDGVRVIARMPVCEAAGIDVLRPLDAFTRYGGRASGGAVVITTRRGDTPRAGC